jgi:branched-chain amino acid transport system substrate-binding protein
VKLLSYDDGADPARNRAQYQEAVEQQRVLAFIGNVDVLVPKNSIDYLRSKGVPVIGASLGAPEYAYESPFYFPQGSAGYALMYTQIANAAQSLVPQGKTKLASIVCAEVQLCRDSDDIFAKNAASLGFQSVYRATSSAAQPDFTAECLNAARAGAQVLILAIDQNSISRISSSCARQNFKPAFALLSSIMSSEQSEDQNIAQLVGATPVAPWFQSGTPATDEFQGAVRKFGVKALTAGTITGWTSGKLFEKATTNLPEPASTAAILQGVWSIKNETLGGLTNPLTFNENQPPARAACWFSVTVQQKNWVTSDGYKLSCKPYPPA